MVDERTYIKVHDGMPENRKIVAAGGDFLGDALAVCGYRLRLDAEPMARHQRPEGPARDP